MKRKQNTTILKFKFIPCTNTKPNRYKVIQTNSNKSIFINSSFGSLTPLEYFTNVLESIECINSYSLVIDNTQNDYYLFCIDIIGSSFDNLLQYFK